MLAAKLNYYTWRKATIKADECGIHQITYFHDLVQGIDIDARAIPDFRAGSSRQHGLYVDALRCQLQAQSLGQKQ